MTLLSAPRKVGARILGFSVHEGDVLRGKIGAWVVLDVAPADPRKSRYRYNRRLTIGRIALADIPLTARLIEWVWDHSRKRRAAA